MMSRFAISDTDSSEEEIFSKGKSEYEERLLKDDRPRPMSSKAAETMQNRPDHHEALLTLSERSPNMSHAEWAMQNMSRRSPGTVTFLKKWCFLVSFNVF